MTLLIIPPYFIFLAFVINAMLRKVNGRNRKLFVLILMIFISYMPLGWDVIYGRIHFNYLCATDGGFHVFNTVELGDEYWNEDGGIGFITQDGYFDEVRMGNLYIAETERDRNYSEISNIAKDRKIIRNVTTTEILGEHISFVYFGGWFTSYSGFSVGGERCYGERGYYKRFLASIFKKHE